MTTAAPSPRSKGIPPGRRSYAAQLAAGGVILATLLLAPSAAQAGWTGRYAAVYRESYTACRLSGPAKVRREYKITSRNDVTVALAQARKAYIGIYQQPSFEGCLDGFLHNRPAVPHVKPWRK